MWMKTTGERQVQIKHLFLYKQLDNDSFLWQEKGTLWEGGVKTAAFIWSPLIKQPSRVSTAMMHISDWVPTFVALAGMLMDTTDDQKT